MSSLIGPGTPLVCINATHPLGIDMRLTEGSIYACERIHPPQEGDDFDCVCKGEGCAARIHIRDKTVQFGYRRIPICYCISRFKPLNDGETSLVEGEEKISTPTYGYKMEPTN